VEASEALGEEEAIDRVSLQEQGYLRNIREPTSVTTIKTFHKSGLLFKI
jgi:hypothetical protein